MYAQAMLTAPVFRLHVIYDRDISVARDARKKWGFKEASDDWKDVVTSKNNNLVIIATPGATHFEMAKMALEQGKHVIISPPFTLKAAEAEELAKLSAQAKTIALVDHHCNFIPARRYALELLKTGKIGVMHSVERTFRSRETLIEYLPERSRWKSNHAAGGGLFWEVVPHDVDFFLRAIGGANAIQASVYSNIRTRVSEQQELISASAFDAVSMQIQFHSGVSLHYSASASNPIRDINEFVFHGSNGTLFIQNDSELIFYGRTGEKERLAIPPKFHLMSVPGHKLCTPVYALLETFASGLYNKTPVSPTFDEALHTQRILDAALSSHETLQPVEMGTEAVVSQQVRTPVIVDKIF